MSNVLFYLGCNIHLDILYGGGFFVTPPSGLDFCSPLAEAGTWVIDGYAVTFNL